MKILIVVLPLIMLQLPLAAQKKITSQKKTVQVAVSRTAVKDSMAINIITCIKKLKVMITDPSVKGTDLTTRYLYTDEGMNRYYYARVPLNGAVASYITKGSTSRYWKYTSWTYNCLVSRMPAGSDNERLAKAYALADSMLKTLPVANGNDIYVNTVAKTDIRYAVGTTATDSLFFTVSYYKEPQGDPEKIGDSVINFYLRGLKDPATQQSAFQQMLKAMDMEDLGSKDFRSKYIGLINMLAIDNIDGAVYIFLNAPFYNDKIYTADLDPALRPKMKERMEKIVSDYRIKQDQAYRERYLGEKPESATPGYGIGTAAYNKKACDENTAHMKYHVGGRLAESYGSREYYISGFDCINKNYSILERKYYPGKKTFFKTDDEIGHYELSTFTIPEEKIALRFKATDETYEICTLCNGSGVGSSTQVRTAGGWEQRNFNLYTYTDPRVVAEWKQREVCPQCNGAGLRKLR